MKGKIRFTWITALIAALALSFSTPAAQRITNNENVTNKTSAKVKASTSRDSKSKKININSASKAELETLPGVGPSTAENIIAARPFKSVKDLKEVSGIGKQRYDDIRPLVTIGSSANRRSDSAGRPASASRASGSDKPTAEAQSRNVIPPGSRKSGGVGAPVSTDSVHLGSDKPGAREKERARANRSSSRDRDDDNDNRSARVGSEKVNINTASQEELESLLGIGPVKAQAIIDNRPYSKPEDVMKVKGIKEGTYEQIRNQITVR